MELFKTDNFETGRISGRFPLDHSLVIPSKGLFISYEVADCPNLKLGILEWCHRLPVSWSIPPGSSPPGPYDFGPEISVYLALLQYFYRISSCLNISVVDPESLRKITHKKAKSRRGGCKQHDIAVPSWHGQISSGRIPHDRYLRKT